MEDSIVSALFYLFTCVVWGLIAGMIMSSSGTAFTAQELIGMAILWPITSVVLLIKCVWSAILFLF